MKAPSDLSPLVVTENALRSVESESRSYRICSNCVMDTTDPEISFDETGTCHHCTLYVRRAQLLKADSDLAGSRLNELVEKIKSNGRRREYDCIIGVSGGVDSTYVAYLVRQLGLRPLAVHLDNGWNSELAVRNIQNICQRLEINLETVVLDWDEFRDLQIAFLRASTPDSEIPTDHAIVSAMYHVSRKNGVPVIAGYNQRTESHLPRSWSQGHYDWRYIKAVQRQYGTRALRAFPHMNWIESQSFVRNLVPILDYVDYNKQAAIRIVTKELGWRDYGKKHFESIYTRFYQGYILPKKFGYDKRRSHLSSLICAGEITRADALQELRQPPYPENLQLEDRKYVVKKFGISDAEFEKIMDLPRKTIYNYPSYAKLLKLPVTPLVRMLYRALIKRWI